MFFKRTKSNPSESWTKMGPMELVFDLDYMTLNGIRFGSEFCFASKFGQPDEFEGSAGAYSKLIHADKGLILEYENGVLDYLGVIFQIDECLLREIRRLERFSPAKMSLRSKDNEEYSLSGSVDMGEVRDFFGQERKVDEDEAELILFYEKGGMTFEFEFTPQHHLKRLNIFPVQDRPPPSSRP